MPASITPGVGDPTIKKEGTPTPSVYYNCSQPGHIARNYLLPKCITDIKEMEEVEEVTDIKNILENENIQKKIPFQAKLELILQRLI